MRCANGRDATTRSCARLSREAAIIFIALVICCVDFTARIRRRKSISDGITQLAAKSVHSLSSLRSGPGLGGRDELRAELFQSPLERCLRRIVEDLLLGDAREDARMTRFEEPVQILLVPADVFDRHGVEET